MKASIRGWPRARTAPREVACDFCDSLQAIVPLEEGECAFCRTCGAELYENRRNSLQRTISFSLSGLLLMGLVLVFPFLAMDNNGLKSRMTVWGTTQSLWEQGDHLMAVTTAAFIVVLPVLLMLSLLYVAGPLLVGRSLPGSVFAFRMVSHLETWVMVEVFFLGTIVSLLKLVKMADISLGVGFWAFGLLVLMVAGALSSIDRLEFWDRLEASKERKEVRS